MQSRDVQTPNPILSSNFQHLCNFFFTSSPTSLVNLAEFREAQRREQLPQTSATFGLASYFIGQTCSKPKLFRLRLQTYTSPLVQTCANLPVRLHSSSHFTLGRTQTSPYPSYSSVKLCPTLHFTRLTLGLHSTSSLHSNFAQPCTSLDLL